MINTRQRINQLRVAYFTPNLYGPNSLRDVGAKEGNPYCVSNLIPCDNYPTQRYHTPCCGGAVGYIPFVAASYDWIYLEQVAVVESDHALAPLSNPYNCCYPRIVRKGRYLMLHDYSNYRRLGYRHYQNNTRQQHNPSWYYLPYKNPYFNICF